jgi:UDP-N-acetylmuramyl pentapeptide phosphotransferase/UDP-N-acetylglucosamine-1-phosphate transferase
MTSAAKAWAMAIEGLTIVAAAAALSAGLIVLLRPLLARYALAKPNARSSHKLPTPQGGGIAVTASTLFVSALAVAFDPPFGAGSVVAFELLASGAILLAITGAIDDIRPLPALPRLLLQTLAVSAVLAAQTSDARIVDALPWWLERGLLLLAGVWFVNLVNFMDGIDLMTVAEVVPVSIGLLLLALLGALPPLAMLMALTLLGATLGFAPFNRPTATLFLGDVGSLPIGLLLFFVLLQLTGRGHLVAALILPLYYLADATITLIRRIIDGEKITQAHRSHFYQLATNRGYSVPEVIVRVFAVNCGLVTLAVTTVLIPSILTVALALALAGALVALLLTAFARGRAP